MSNQRQGCGRPQCLLVFGLPTACTFQVHPGIQSKIKKRLSCPLQPIRGRCGCHCHRRASRRVRLRRQSHALARRLSRVRSFQPFIKTIHLIWALQPQGSSQQNQDGFNPFVLFGRRDQVRLHLDRSQVNPSVHVSPANARFALMFISTSHVKLRWASRQQKQLVFLFATSGLVYHRAQ